MTQICEVHLAAYRMYRYHQRDDRSLPEFAKRPTALRSRRCVIVFIALARGTEILAEDVQHPARVIPFYVLLETSEER